MPNIIPPERIALRKQGQQVFLAYIESLCKARRITVYRIMIDCNLPQTLVSNIRKGYRINSVSLDIIILISNRYQFPFLLSDYLA